MSGRQRPEMAIVYTVSSTLLSVDARRRQTPCAVTNRSQRTTLVRHVPVMSLIPPHHSPSGIGRMVRRAVPTRRM